MEKGSPALAGGVPDCLTPGHPTGRRPPAFACPLFSPLENSLQKPNMSKTKGFLKQWQECLFQSLEDPVQSLDFPFQSLGFPVLIPDFPVRLLDFPIQSLDFPVLIFDWEELILEGKFRRFEQE